MILSEDRVSYLARIVVDGLWNDDLVDYVDDDAALRAAKKGLNEFVKTVQEVDKDVQAKVASLKRNIPEGSPEWDIMYGKYFEEEMKRRGTD